MRKQKKEIPISFKNERKYNLVGILHLPEIKKPPVVVICHGFQNSKTERKYVKLARALQEEGILVFRFDFEGCGDSEGSPRNLTVAREVSDLNSALKTVFKECDGDPKKIALIGGSLGSVVISLFVEKFKISVKTLIFLSQAFCQKELFKIWQTKADEKEIREKGFVIKGEKEIGRDYWLENRNKDYSSLLSEIKVPILLIHGKKDEDVPLKYSEKLAQKYKNITLKVLPKANHKFDDFKSQEELIKIITSWLKKYLIP